MIRGDFNNSCGNRPLQKVCISLGLQRSWQIAGGPWRAARGFCIFSETRTTSRNSRKTAGCRGIAEEISNPRESSEFCGFYGNHTSNPPTSSRDQKREKSQKRAKHFAIPMGICTLCKRIGPCEEILICTSPKRW